MKSKENIQKTTSIIMLALMILNIAIGVSSCKKQDDFLNVKRLNSDVTPSTLKDFQAVLDNTGVFNSIYPSIGLLGTDNVSFSDATLKTATSTERNSYLWTKDIFEGQFSGEWTSGYQIVEYANVVLDGLNNIKVTNNNLTQFNQVKGSALFYRSLSFFGLAELFSPQYDSATANTDLGIPLRLSSDVNIPSYRSTTRDTYNQIVNDLKTALTLLPIAPEYTTRPSQISVNALLAKVFLCMQDYVNAGYFANAALKLNNKLLDYNSTLVSKSSIYHFPTFQVGNPEITFWAYPQGYATLRANGPAIVDTSLFNSYSTKDLRKSLYFKNAGNNAVSFVGSYLGTLNRFAGISNNEVYLIRAECFARAGNLSAAMEDLNTLLSKRWITDTFTPLKAINPNDALSQILKERRKELPFTGLVRWEDLKRLNKDPTFSVTIVRKTNGVVYTLLPNDKRYVFPIPDLEIQKYNLLQNIR